MLPSHFRGERQKLSSIFSLEGRRLTERSLRNTAAVWPAVCFLSRGPDFDACSGRRLSQLSVFMVLFSFSSQMLGYYFRTCHDRFLPEPSQFIICNHCTPHWTVNPAQERRCHYINRGRVHFYYFSRIEVILVNQMLQIQFSDSEPQFHCITRNCLAVHALRSYRVLLPCAVVVYATQESNSHCSRPPLSTLDGFHYIFFTFYYSVKLKTITHTATQAPIMAVSVTRFIAENITTSFLFPIYIFVQHSTRQFMPSHPTRNSRSQAMLTAQPFTGVGRPRSYCRCLFLFFCYFCSLSKFLCTVAYSIFRNQKWREHLLSYTHHAACFPSFCVVSLIFRTNLPMFTKPVLSAV